MMKAAWVILCVEYNYHAHVLVRPRASHADLKLQPRPTSRLYIIL